MKTPFPIDPVLTAIAIAYRNTRMIADSVLPRTPVGSADFKYLVHNKSDRFTIPNTRVGRKGRVNEVEFGASEQTASTTDFGLEDAVPQHDIDNAPANYDPLGHATEGIMDLVELAREVRVASAVFNAATYPTANKITLAGTDQWSDFANSDPIGDIQAGLDAPIVRPNVLVIGRPAFSVLTRHPSIMKAVHGTAGDSGVARRQQLAELFELEEVLVGEAFVNTAKPGQAPNFQRAWGKHTSLIHRNPVANVQRGVTFGLTAQHGDRVAGSWEDRNIGLRGGVRVRAGESVAELVMAADVGYFIQNAVA